MLRVKSAKTRIGFLVEMSLFTRRLCSELLVHQGAHAQFPVQKQSAKLPFLEYGATLTKCGHTGRLTVIFIISIIIIGTRAGSFKAPGSSPSNGEAL